MAEVKTALRNPAFAEVRGTEVPSLAVLPFANLSADKENEYFSDGLAEEILNALAKVPGLRVIARTSAFAFRGRGLDLAAVGTGSRWGTYSRGAFAELVIAFASPPSLSGLGMSRNSGRNGTTAK
jgi:hypothetical protein